MDRQNITLSLPKEILLKAKLLAVQRQTSVSGLLTQALENLVRQQGGLAHARQRHLQWLEQGADLGTGGQIPAGRDELHNRTCGLQFVDTNALVSAHDLSAGPEHSRARNLVEDE